MVEEPSQATWTHALALYDSLEGPGWHHIQAFRPLVAALSCAPEVSGLSAVTSHETLIVSQYTRYPDWFDGRHVRVHPLPDGRVRVEMNTGSFDGKDGETQIVALADALEAVLRLVVEL